jgi:hypothetical protein
METINWWILAPLLIFLSLITIPIVYVWVSVYGGKLRRISSVKSTVSVEQSVDLESASTQIPENVLQK